jgi:molybdopterin/thiamine biosynthesis adenylyltransferase
MKGKLHVTDLDTIEESNLSRQFLFRKGKPKTKTRTRWKNEK